MKKQQAIRQLAAVCGVVCLMAVSAMAVDSPTKAIPNGEKEKVSGIIQGRDGDTMRVRTEDNSVVVVDLTDTTKVQLKHGLFHLGKKKMDVTTLVPGLKVEASGKGNEQGQLVADTVRFDPDSYRASRAIDTRVSPLESRQGQLEGRAGQLESRAGKLETQTGQLEATTGKLSDQQKTDEQTIGQVKNDADQANQGVNSVNGRVNALDDYAEKAKATVYFRFGSAKLTEDAQRDLDDLIQKTKSMKGYMIEVAGFTDTTGNAQKNEELSEKRADAVVRYLQQGDVPLRRILAPAGLGESHSVADNKTVEGRKLNRRVEVRVLVNSTLQGTSANAMNSNTAAPQSAQ
jgi:outer membrane protein OmpA-like peptidoglycan-associated protein